MLIEKKNERKKELKKEGKTLLNDIVILGQNFKNMFLFKKLLDSTPFLGFLNQTP